MPSNHPIPSLAALALSLYASDRAVERLPVIAAYDPYQTVTIATTNNVTARAGDYL